MGKAHVCNQQHLAALMGRGAEGSGEQQLASIWCKQARDQPILLWKPPLLSYRHRKNSAHLSSALSPVFIFSLNRSFQRGSPRCQLCAVVVHSSVKSGLLLILFMFLIYLWLTRNTTRGNGLMLP